MKDKVMEAIERLLKKMTVSQQGQDEMTIIQALTTPTEEELCQALSEYLKCKVFISTTNMICIRHKDYESNIIFSDNKIDFDEVYLPPHIITMIGRFYNVQDD